MKKIACLISILLFVSSSCFAQQQWRFYVAFEDATSAKDTIWLIWDTTATGGVPGLVDTALGEGAIQFNQAIFNVWVHNDNFDSTKTFAYPYNYTLATSVFAFNYQYPIIVTWDSSLFHAPYLPMPVGYVNVAGITNNYFYDVNNDPPLHGFNMLWDNNAIAPYFNWGSQSQFPMNFAIIRDPLLSNQDLLTNVNKIKIYPNPFTTELLLSSVEEICTIEIYSITGQFLLSRSFKNPIKLSNYVLTIPYFNAGLYIIKLTNTKNQFVYEKAIKTN